MIKVVEITGKDSDGVIATLFADTKDEVAETGKLTAVVGLVEPLSPSSMLYTASLEIACLNHSDTWVWKE